MTTTTTPPRGVRIFVELDKEAAEALGRAAREDRLSRPAYLRHLTARHLREIGVLASNTAEPAR